MTAQIPQGTVAPAAPKPVELDETIVAWYEAARVATQKITRYTEIRDRAYQLIKDAMGDATEATIGGRPAVTWAPSKPSEFIDKKALEEKYPDIAAEFTKVKKAARPFRILDAG